MGVNSLPKTVARQRRDCDLNPGPSAPESSTLKAKFHYTDPTRTGPDTDKVRAYCRRRAKFHYTDPTRTRTDFFCGETPLGPCGSGRVRVLEFTRQRARTLSVSSPCRVRVVEFSYNHSATEPPF